MIDRFKKVFVICSTDHYDFLEEHKDEILEKHKNKKIEMPYLFGKINDEFDLMLEAADAVLTDKGDYSTQKRMELAEKTLLEDKLNDAEKRMKRASLCLFIDPNFHPNKFSEELSDAASIEVTLELLEARHQNIKIELIDPTQFTKAKQKRL